MLHDTGEQKMLVSDEEHVVLQVLVQLGEVDFRSPQGGGSRPAPPGLGSHHAFIVEPSTVRREVGVVDGRGQGHRLGAAREDEAQVVH
jgi:hypothetical protein